MNNTELEIRIEKAEFKKRRVIEFEEQKVFFKLIELVRTFNNNFFVYPQMTLGEIVKCTSGDAHPDINSKRVDFCIANRRFEPVAVIEYHGVGHFKYDIEKTKDRDDIIYKAVTKAGYIMNRYINMT